MADAFARRVEAVRSRMRAEKLDALLVTHPPNVSYLTGFTGDSSAVLLGTDRSVIVSDFRYETQLRDECPGQECHIRPSSKTLAQELGEVLAGFGWRSVGFESASLSVLDWETIRNGCGSVELRSTAGVVEEVRAVKDEAEIAAIRRAIDLAEQVFERVRHGWSGHWDEAEVANRLESELRSLGAAGSAFPPIVAVGPRSALPHARPEPGVRVDSGDFTLIDWGACLGPMPYRSDLTRVIVTGKVTPRFEEIYGIVVEAQRRAIASIRPGISAGEVDAQARSYIQEAGFGRFFDHGLGHGIGLEIHEAPRLRKDAAEVLRPGMVLTIEPGIYLPDWGGIRIEDDVLVTPDGCECLSRLPRDLDRIRDDTPGA
ncbi:M24 family metallopeptidase [Tautonia marina]|uniref:M24 family metallopeptidase n=1 Tax=Tautonia marina TaxID=2653855 RepID=UPI001261131C|nr:Xaa-Pro peptidase family protein [Tautonia marina]